MFVNTIQNIYNIYVNLRWFNEQVKRGMAPEIKTLHTNILNHEGIEAVKETLNNWTKN